jgi:hypothetical protein
LAPPVNNSLTHLTPPQTDKAGVSLEPKRNARRLVGRLLRHRRC